MYYLDIDIGLVPALIYFSYLICYCIGSALSIGYSSVGGVQERKKAGLVFLCFFSIYAVFYCIDSDYFRYREFCVYADRIIEYYHKERIYCYMALLVRQNYELYRLLIWGSALVLTYISVRLINGPVLYSLLFLFASFADKFCYGRFSLATAFFFLGVVIVSKFYHRKKIYVASGIVLILLSILFHRSMIIGIITFPITLISINDKQKLILVSLLSVVASLFLFLFVSDTSSLLGEEYESTIDGYMTAIEGGRWDRNSIKNILSSLWGWSSFYIPFIIVTKKIFTCPISEFKEIKALYKVTYGFILIASIMLIVFGFNNPFFYRVLFMTMIPISIIVSKLFSINLITPKTMKITLALTVVYHIFYMLTNMSNIGVI